MTMHALEQNIEKINPLQIQRFLKATGWDSVASKRSHIGIFTYQKENAFFEITLPLKKSFSDYSDGVKSVVDTISEVMDLDFNEVVDRLLLPLADIVKFRIKNVNTQNGTISFDEGFSLLENAKKSLYITACDIIQPKIYHNRLSVKKASEFINFCRLGQTQQGSYAASVVCPFVSEFENKFQEISIFDDVELIHNSFTRKVTENLMQSLASLQSLIENDAFDNIYTVDNPLFSGNFVESIINMNLIDTDSIIEISTEWAPSVKSNQKIAKVSFTQDHLIPAKRWVKKIKEKESKRGIYFGRISQVKTNPDPSKRTDAEFTLNFLDELNKSKTAKVIIPSDDLSFATDALENGKMVKVSGVLEGNKQKIITDPDISFIE